MKQYTKEGQVSGAVGAIIQLIVGVGVATLVLIFVGTLGGQTYQLSEAKIDEIGVNFVNNQTFTAFNGTAVSLGHPDVHVGSLNIYNVTNGVDVTANFTVDYSAGTATLKAFSPQYNNTVFKSTYTWGLQQIQDSIKNSILSSFGALEQTGDYLPIVVLAVVIALVMMLVLGFTNMGGSGGGNSAL